LLGEQPECVLHRQQGFVVNALPPELRFGPDADIDFFVLPGVDADQPAPLLVGSTVAVAFTNRPEVDAVLAHLATPASTRRWAQEGGLVRPHRTVDIGELTPVDRAATEAIRNATIIRADASDAMSPDIGSGLLWQEITRWVADDISYDRFATTIDTARTDQT
jgi:alpha-glucoside transport system substrate-binding protein